MTEATSIATAIRANIELQPNERLYAVVDACQDAELAFGAETRYGQKIRMLFEGEAADYMRDVAPYLIPVDLETDYLEVWAAHWGKNVGILLTSPADPETLFRHLRQIFVVQDEAGQEYFFRYYDPRILRVFLPTCTAVEASAFFGPVHLFLCVSDEIKTICKFTIGPDDIASVARIPIAI